MQLNPWTLAGFAAAAVAGVGVAAVGVAGLGVAGLGVAGLGVGGLGGAGGGGSRQQAAGTTVVMRALLHLLPLFALPPSLKRWTDRPPVNSRPTAEPLPLLLPLLSLLPLFQHQETYEIQKLQKASPAPPTRRYHRQDLGFASGQEPTDMKRAHLASGAGTPA